MSAPRAPWSHALPSASLLALVLVTAPTLASADGFGGKWKQSAMRVDYKVQTWPVDVCGPPPASESIGGGESITVTEEGDELTFVGGGRTYNSRQCYDNEVPSLARESHSHDPAARTWRTRCTTPASDPRRATLNTLVQATSDKRIQITETGRYELTLDKGKCTADVVRTRSFDLVAVAAPAPSVTAAPPPSVEVAPTVAPTPTVPARDCASPGPPAELRARPSRKILRQGDSFAFAAAVLDARGCATHTPTVWATTNPSGGISVDANGKVTVAADAPEGSTEVTVSAGGKTARVSVDVTSASHYDALLASSGLNASGESDAASSVSIASGSVGGGEGRADDGARKRKALFVGLVVALAAALGGVAFVARRRARRAAAIARDAEERHAERVREIEERKRRREFEHAERLSAHEESLRKVAAHAVKHRLGATPAQPMLCASCRREYPSGSTFCPADGSRLAPLGADSTMPGPAGGVCPTCRRGYDPAVKKCPEHGDELVPAAMLVTAAPALPKAKGRICPTCGARFAGESTFCGADGTALVLLN